MARKSYRWRKKKRQQRRNIWKIARNAVLTGAAFLLIASLIVALNGGTDFGPEPTPTAQIIGEVPWIEVEYTGPINKGVSVFPEPTLLSDEIGMFVRGDFVLFLGRHEREGWYLVNYHEIPGWIRVDISNLRLSLSGLPLVTEENASAKFAPTTPQPSPIP